VIGDRIRSVRTTRNVTLRRLASDAGVSPALISQVERGITDPSLDTLRRIAQALDIPLFDLFQDPSESEVAVVRAASRSLIRSPHGGLSYSRVSPGFGKLEVLEGVLEPHRVSSETPWAHPSEECVLVTVGLLTVEVDGDLYHLRQGDSCYFDSRRPHRYLNDHDIAAVFTLSVTPPSY
jgi:transcriptional regulator with XRE-family HTH domain